MIIKNTKYTQSNLLFRNAAAYNPAKEAKAVTRPAAIPALDNS